MRLLFDSWWVLENVTTHYFAFDFLSCETETNRRIILPFWLVSNAVLTICVIHFHIPGAFLWDMLFLAFFSRFILKIRLKETAAPIAALITLFTLKEGFSAAILSWASRNLYLPNGGLKEQVLFSMVLVLLFCFSLHYIRSKYSKALQQTASSCLYLMLLPCILFVCLIRFSLQLDSRSFAPYLISLSTWFRSIFLFLLAAAAIMFGSLLKIDYQLMMLGGKEKQAAFLEYQLAGQQSCIDEALNRNAQYASFQHDIDNHLLVLSGLLHEKQFVQAETYLSRLKQSSKSPPVPILTGNMALDILLREKLGYAESQQIKVTHHIKIPPSFSIDSIDLCALFSNLLDNAITAAQKKPHGQRSLSLQTAARSHFLTIEAINTAVPTARIKAGTGLQNIRQIAEKYHGCMETEQKDGCFRISILLYAPPADGPFTNQE